MQLTQLLQAIETLKSEGWQIKPPSIIGRPRIIREAMTTANQKRSLATKRAWKRRKKAA
jgi:hypothetical protein